MKKCYTISGLKSLYTLPKLDCCQITLNGRQFPSKRKTVAALQSLREANITTPIIIHYDFIYIISRYSMFKQSVKEAVMEEITGLLRYAEGDPNVLGIVMHTDWPIKKEFQVAPDKNQFITDNYSGSLWEVVKVRELIHKDVLEESVIEFVDDLKQHYHGNNTIKILLENTTKVGPQREGSLMWIKDLFIKYPYLNQYLGIVYDTEHHYAVTGEWLTIQQIDDLKFEVDTLIVHLNTVPKEVKPCSGKDRHSETTIEECSVNENDFYKDYTTKLDARNIPWVREVKEETMFREFDLL